MFVVVLCVSSIVIAEDQQYVMVEFNRFLSPLDRIEMEANGIEFVQYHPHKTYTIQAGGFGLEWLETSAWVDSIDSVPVQSKLDAGLMESIHSAALQTFSLQKEAKKSVQLLFQPNISYLQAKKILFEYGVTLPVDQYQFDSSQTLRSVQVPINKLHELAGEDAVFLITEIEPPAEATNANAQKSANMDAIQMGGETGYELDGTGVSVGIWDVGGVQLNHPQFSGRAKQMDGGSPNHFHPTHVAGTVGADGTGNAQAEGMAPNVTLLCWNASLDNAEMEANADRIVASNHSYRTSANMVYDDSVSQWKQRSARPYQSHPNIVYGRYTAKSRAFDQIAAQSNLNIVVSAGNNQNDIRTSSSKTLAGIVPTQSDDADWDNRYDTINTIATGKNTITVGAVADLPVGATEITIHDMTRFSSWGPTDDGRIKPDICTNGESLLSLNSNLNNPTKLQSGTSMSAPVVTGTIANLTQLFRRRFGGFDPSNSTMKAVLIHTTRDAGRVGPDYSFGWGVLDARAAADFIYNQGVFGDYIINDAFVDGTKRYTASYVGGASIVATLVWTDPPAYPNVGSIDDTVSKLINDLDIRIIGPDGEHYPWALDPSNPEDPAERNSTNHRDNVEQVAIDVPADGEYTIEISGQVNMGSVQSYTLCVTGMEISGSETNRSRVPRIYILNPQTGKSSKLITAVQVHTESLTPLTDLSIELNGELIHQVEISPASNSVIQPASSYVYDASVSLNTFLLENGPHSLAVSAFNEEGETSENTIAFDVENVGVSFQLIPNGERRTAQLFDSPNKILAGLFIEEDGYYAIETHAVTEQITADTILTIVGPDSQTRVLARDDDSGVELFSKTIQYLESGSYYYVQIAGFSGSTGWFGIDVVSTDEPPLPPEEQPAQPVDITPLEINQPEKFAIQDYGERHFYSFTTTVLSNYRIRALPEDYDSQASFELELYHPDDLTTPIEEGTFVNEISRNIDAGTQLLLQVTAPKTKGSYLLEVAALSDLDPIPVNQARMDVHHEFTTMEAEDRWFRLRFPSTTSYIIDIENTGDDLDTPLHIFMYGPNDPANLIGQLYLDGKPKATFIKHLERNATYYIQLLSETGSGSYSLRFDNPNLRKLYSELNPLSNLQPSNFTIIQPAKQADRSNVLVQDQDIESIYFEMEDGRVVDEQPQGILDWTVY